MTSALIYGGKTPPTVYANTELWNGSAWTEVADLNTARFELAGAGASNSSALAFAGEAPPGVAAVTEDWNGVSWVEVADLSTARDQLAGNGTLTSALASGGNTGSTSAATEEWNSTSNTTKTVDTD